MIFCYTLIKGYDVFIKLLFIILSIGLFFIGCDSTEKKQVVVKQSDIVQKTIGIEGMTCVGCEVTLEGSISKIEGVVKVKASVASDSATVSYDKTKTNLAEITKTIKSEGYTPRTNASVVDNDTYKDDKPVVVDPKYVVEETITVDGMRGVRCEAKVEEALEKLGGVVFVEASAENHQAVIEYDKSQTSQTKILQTIKQTGYTPKNP